MKKVIVLYGSSRENGNTEYLTDYALNQIQNGVFTKVYLRNHTIQPLTDERHSSEPFPTFEDDYKKILQQTLNADIIIFSTPVYWYNMSTKTKLFVDRLTESLRDSSIQLKDEMKHKQMYVICTGANPDQRVVQPMIGIFKLMANYFQMEFKGYFWANANRPGDIREKQDVLDQAREFFEEGFNSTS